MQASVCNIEKGLKKEDILLLCKLHTAPQETHTKVLQFFVKKEPTVSALKIYADNFQSDESKLTGSVNVVKFKSYQRDNQSKGKSDMKCPPCQRTSNHQETCRVTKCDYCHKTGHMKAKCYVNPDSSSYKGPNGWGTGNGNANQPATVQ